MASSVMSFMSTRMRPRGPPHRRCSVSAARSWGSASTPAWMRISPSRLRAVMPHHCTSVPSYHADEEAMAIVRQIRELIVGEVAEVVAGADPGHARQVVGDLDQRPGLGVVAVRPDQPQRARLDGDVPVAAQPEAEAD